MTVLEQLPQGARVCVIRLRSMGDCVLTTPALALLKERAPDLEIGVVVEPPFAPVFAGNPVVSQILPPHGTHSPQLAAGTLRQPAWRHAQPLDDAA